MSESHQIISFGKYKGQPAEVLQSDPEYCQWLQGQDWFAQRFPGISTLIINNFGKPEDTPEHNRLQAMFTKPDFVKKLLLSVYDVVSTVNKHKSLYKAMYQKCMLAIEKERANLQKEKETASEWRHVIDPEDARVECSMYGFQEIGQGRYGYKNGFWHNPSPGCFCNRASDKNSSAGKFTIDNVSVENNGWDVVVSASIINPYGYYTGAENDDSRYHVYVEIKPSVGDDYPSIMRQMLANKAKSINNRNTVYVLLYDSFCATGASLEEVQVMFANNSISMVSFTQVESISDDDERFCYFSKNVASYEKVNPAKCIRIKCKNPDEYENFKKSGLGRLFNEIELLSYIYVKIEDSNIYTTADKIAAKWNEGYSVLLVYEEDGSSSWFKTVLFPRDEEKLIIELRKIFGEDNFQIVSAAVPQPRENNWVDMLRTVHEKDIGLYSFLMCGTAEILPDGKVQWTPAEGFTKNLCSKPGVAKIIQKSFADAAGSSISIVTAK